MLQECFQVLQDKALHLIVTQATAVDSLKMETAVATRDKEYKVLVFILLT